MLWLFVGFCVSYSWLLFGFVAILGLLFWAILLFCVAMVWFFFHFYEYIVFSVHSASFNCSRLLQFVRPLPLSLKIVLYVVTRECLVVFGVFACMCCCSVLIVWVVTIGHFKDRLAL